MEDKPTYPVWASVAESFFSKLVYLAIIAFIGVLILNNHSNHTMTYVEMLKELFFLGLPSPLAKTK